MRSHRIKTAALCCVAVWLLSFPRDAAAHDCKAPSAEKIVHVRDYVAKIHNHDGDDLALTASRKSGKGCFWELQFHSKSANDEITAYLSPDRRFVFSDVIDLQIDPLVELRQRQQELTKRLASPGLPSLGPPAAAVTIVEFSDFECPYCEQFSHVLKDTIKVDRSVNVVFRNFPIAKHPWARSAAEMSACAAIQSESGFWKLHDFFFSDRRSVNQRNIFDKAMAFVETNTDLDTRVFKKCIDEHQSAGMVDRDIAIGRVNDVHATPTFFVNGVRYQGLRDSAQLQAILGAARRGDVWPVSVSHTHADLPSVVSAKGERGE